MPDLTLNFDRLAFGATKTVSGLLTLVPRCYPGPLDRPGFDPNAGRMQMTLRTGQPRLALVALGAAGAIALAMPAAHASLIADGITYTLTETSTPNPLVNDFELTITTARRSTAAPW